MSAAGHPRPSACGIGPDLTLLSGILPDGAVAAEAIDVRDRPVTAELDGRAWTARLAQVY